MNVQWSQQAINSYMNIADYLLTIEPYTIINSHNKNISWQLLNL